MVWACKKNEAERIPRMILEWTVEGKRRGKLKDQRMDGMRRSMTRRGLIEEEGEDEPMEKKN